MKRLVSAGLIAISLALSLATGVVAQTAAPAGGSCSLEDYKGALGMREASGRYGIKSPSGYLGRYQMGYEALQTAGLATGGTSNSNIVWAPGMSESKFLSSPAIQDKAYADYANANWGYLGRAKGLSGQVLPNGKVITDSGVLMAGQFGHVRVKNYFDNGGICDASTTDGNGVCVREYLDIGSGYDVSSLTGEPSDVGTGGECKTQTQPEEEYKGDETSKTCTPTVPMLQAIPCEKYPASIQGFCYRYKPLQMNMGECQAAERWAETVPPSGPHLESCKEQTFGKGTSSWSYVHGCAKAEPAMGKKGEDNLNQKVVGNADDPACYERLKARGIEFTPLGKVDISTGGRTCIVANAVQYNGKEVPFDKSVTLNCALVEQLEDFGPTARGMGVQEYKVLSTLACRGINNTKGTNQSKTTLHGFGNAIDINGFVVGGQLITTASYFNNPTNRAWLTKLRDIGCQNFDGTLAFRFYNGEWTHVHWQATERTSCDPNP